MEAEMRWEDEEEKKPWATTKRWELAPENDFLGFIFADKRRVAMDATNAPNRQLNSMR